MDEAPKKRVNKGLLLFSTLLAVLVVGSFTVKVIISRPDIKVTKHKITRVERDAFREQVNGMVAHYSVRLEGGLPIVHPPAGSDIYLLARNYDWGKFVLELEKGRLYRLHLASMDMRHAIVVHELKLMYRIKPDEIKVIAFKPVGAGRFKLICGEFCGPGHASMTGTLIVVEP